MKHGFTLVELAIVTILLSILIGVLFQTYTVISRTAFHSQITANLQQETLFLTQSLQNDIDQGSIVVSSTPSRSSNCEILGDQGKILYEKVCDTTNQCGIVRSHTSQKQLMTNPDIVQVKEFNCLNLGNSGNVQGMRLRFDVTSRKYPMIHQELQTFFQSQS